MTPSITLEVRQPDLADPSAARKPAPEPGQPERRPINFSTKLLAGSFYTRGMWGPFAAWRSLAGCPYRTQSVNWGVDPALLRAELRRAFTAAWLWTAVELAVLVGFVNSVATGWAPLLIFLVLLQWIVFPYFAVRAAFRRLETAERADSGARSHQVILKDTDGSIGDMGYLLREATFSVDCTKKVESWTAPDQGACRGITTESFYTDIEQVFAGTASGLDTIRVTTLAAKDAQPRFADWPRWIRPKQEPAQALAGTGLSRLLVVGQDPQVDGLAAVEFIAKMVGPHVSFRLRMRWLPGCKTRLQKLGLLIRQKAWWRGAIVPAGIAFLLMTAWVVGSFLLLNGRGDVAIASFSQLLGARNPFPEEFPPLSQIPMEMLPLAFSMMAFTKGALAPFAWLAALAAFLPPILLLVALILRGARFARGLLYSATGTYFFTGSNSCLRFKVSGSGSDDEDSLQTAISYLQIMEQVITNRIVHVLQQNGVDSASIRDEMKLFVNQGIYMTGGELRASNVLVGAKGIIGSFKRRAARSGKRAVMARTSS